MRLTTNFTVPVGNVTPLLAIKLWAGAVLALALIVWLIVDTGRLRQETPALDARLTELTAKRAGMTETALPAKEELLALKARVAAINSLGNLRGSPLPTMLAMIENLMPDQVYLTNLQHKPASAELRLIAESQNAEALTLFLFRLQQEPRFDEVLLTRQAQRVQQGQKRVQFELRVREKD